MELSDNLRELNVEIAARETVGGADDVEWFRELLATDFSMRRASGGCDDKDGFLSGVEPSPERRTTDVAGTEIELTAAVTCVVSMKQKDGSWESFRNFRTFVRADSTANWQLLGWANEPISPQLIIERQVPLRFAGDEKTLEDLQNLSAVYHDGDWLWVACDELTTVERLTRGMDEGKEEFTDHRSFPLGDLGVTLPDGNQKEIDVEGMDVADGYLWVVGSHSSTRDRLKPKDAVETALKDFSEVHERPNRHVLCRIALEQEGDDARLVKATTAAGQRSITAALIGDLTEVLKEDPHLKGSLPVPAKENGLDVEGLAVFGTRVLLGLRGPVLRGWAVVVEVEPQPDPADSTRLRLGSPPYRKHLLNMNELGVRDLVRDGDDILLLAGPPMGLDGPVRLYRWRKARFARDQQIVTGPDLALIGDLPYGKGDDHAEGITVISPPGKRAQLLVVYDSPSKARLTDGSDGTLSILADVTSPLPETAEDP